MSTQSRIVRICTRNWRMPTITRTVSVMVAVMRMTCEVRTWSRSSRSRRAGSSSAMLVASPVGAARSVAESVSLGGVGAVVRRPARAYSSVG